MVVMSKMLNEREFDDAVLIIEGGSEVCWIEITGGAGSSHERIVFSRRVIR